MPEAGIPYGTHQRRTHTHTPPRTPETGLRSNIKRHVRPQARLCHVPGSNPASADAGEPGREYPGVRPNTPSLGSSPAHLDGAMARQHRRRRPRVAGPPPSPPPPSLPLCNPQSALAAGGTSPAGAWGPLSGHVWHIDRAAHVPRPAVRHTRRAECRRSAPSNNWEPSTRGQTRRVSPADWALSRSRYVGLRVSPMWM